MSAVDPIELRSALTSWRPVALPAGFVRSLPRGEKERAVARILLVEDDIDVRPLLEYILHVEGGYEVFPVSSLASALAMLNRQPFDLVVADVNLPDGSGLNAADVAKHTGTPSLILTAHGLSLKPRDLTTEMKKVLIADTPEAFSFIEPAIGGDAAVASATTMEDALTAISDGVDHVIVGVHFDGSRRPTR